MPQRVSLGRGITVSSVGREIELAHFLQTAVRRHALNGLFDPLHQRSAAIDARERGNANDLQAVRVLAEHKDLASPGQLYGLIGNQHPEIKLSRGIARFGFERKQHHERGFTLILNWLRTALSDDGWLP